MDNKFTMTNDCTTPRYSLDKTHQVFIPTKEEWGKDWPKRHKTRDGKPTFFLALNENWLKNFKLGRLTSGL